MSREIQIHHPRRLTAPDGVQVDIDAGMVALIQSSWALDLKTTARCEDFGEGVAGQRAIGRSPSPYGGDGFIAFYAGYAWLEMPLPDAIRFAGLLVGTEFHAQVTRRWTPGSWRMHVPIISSQDNKIHLSARAQIHFPREQIGDLVSALGNISGTDAYPDWDHA